PLDCIERVGCSSSAEDFGSCPASCAGPVIQPPVAPAKPAPPSLRPCPSGWAEDIEPDLVRCVPPPSPARVACSTMDEAQFFGDAACTKLGEPCPPSGGFSGALPSSGVLYVRAGAPSGGNGTNGAPFRTIAEAAS